MPTTPSLTPLAVPLLIQETSSSRLSQPGTRGTHHSAHRIQGLPPTPREGFVKDALPRVMPNGVRQVKCSIPVLHENLLE